MDVISISSSSRSSSPISVINGAECETGELPITSVNNKYCKLDRLLLNDVSKHERSGKFSKDEQHLETSMNDELCNNENPAGNIHVISSSDESDHEIANSELINTNDQDNDSDELPSVPEWMSTKRAKGESDDSQETIKNGSSYTKAPVYKKSKSDKVVAKKSKEQCLAERLQRQAEKLQRQAEQAQAKAVKKALAKAQRSLKQGECLKYVKAVLDPDLLVKGYGGELLVALQAGNMQYVIQKQSDPSIITWTRTVYEHAIDDDLKLQEVMQVKTENQVLVIRPWDQVLELVANQQLNEHIQRIQANYHGSKLTLVVYKLEHYYRQCKAQKRRDVRSKVRGEKVKTTQGASAEISRLDVEMALGTLQINGYFHHLVDTPGELGALVAHFTKAVAETPFRSERTKKEDMLEWFGMSDSQDCVKVDKNGHGLLRLWQQQLCQFELAGLETAEAIMSKYHSPQALIQAYENCATLKEGETLLQDIPIRRGTGPLMSVRRIGPELSRTVYSFFTAIDGDMPLSLSQE